MKTYNDGRNQAMKEIIQFLVRMETKYPMTGNRDKIAAFKNGYYDVAYEIHHGWRAPDESLR